MPEARRLLDDGGREDLSGGGDREEEADDAAHDATGPDGATGRRTAADVVGGRER
jgi:hypothetical protein